MPQVEICVRCKKELTEKDKFVVISEAYQGVPRHIACVECAQKKR